MLSLFQKLLLLSVILLIYSCSHISKNEIAIFKVLNTGLANSNLVIHRQTEVVYHALENKLSDPSTHYKAAIWYPKATMAQKLSSEIFVYIQNLKANLLHQAGFEKDHLSFNEDDRESVNRLFTKERKDVELFQKLDLYKDSMREIDPFINQEFHNYSLIPKASENVDDKEDSLKVLFENTSIMAAIAVLTQIQNNVKVFENKVASFCNQQVTNDAFVIDVLPSPIIFQSSKYVKPNDELEISAGLGIFETRNNLKVSINNKVIEPNDYGYADLKLKVKSQTGTYNIPVRIEYTDQDANKRVIDRIIRYTVIN
jgi:hypothetical protein